MSHDAFRQHDAAYVLGALTPGERQAFEDHMRECRECRRAVSEVAGLPGLLSRVGPEVLEQADDGPEAPVPDTLLPRLLAEVRRTRRRRRAWSGAAAAAAAVAVLAAGTTVWVNRAEAPPQETVVAGRVMTALPGAHLRARLAMEDVPWGTRLSVTCRYDKQGSSYGGGAAEPPAYALVVRTRDGVEQVATWRAVPGRETTVTGATAARSSEITSVEVRTTSGEPVLRLAG